MNLSVPFSLRRVTLLLEMTTFEGLQDVVHRDALDDILEFVFKLYRIVVLEDGVSTYLRLVFLVWV